MPLSAATPSFGQISSALFIKLLRATAISSEEEAPAAGIKAREE